MAVHFKKKWPASMEMQATSFYVLLVLAILSNRVQNAFACSRRFQPYAVELPSVGSCLLPAQLGFFMSEPGMLMCTTGVFLRLRRVPNTIFMVALTVTIGCASMRFCRLFMMLRSTCVRFFRHGIYVPPGIISPADIDALPTMPVAISHNCSFAIPDEWLHWNSLFYSCCQRVISTSKSHCKFKLLETMIFYGRGCLYCAAA